MIDNIKEIYAYRQMLVNTVKRDLRARYKGSFLGFLWTYINPLLQLIVYSLVFPYILRMQQENYPLFLFVALLPWIFFITSVQSSTTSILAGANLVKKIYFPRLLLPLSVVATNLMNYFYGLIITIIILVFSGVSLTLNILWLPIILIVEVMFILGLSMIFSALYVRFRDLEHIVNVVTFVWFYFTPIVFPITIFPEQMAKYIDLNPLVPIINSIRDVLLYGQPPEWAKLSYSFGVSLVLLVLGYIIFMKCEKTFAEDI